MNEDIKKLIEELKTSGASQKESEELSLLSKNLSNLYNFQRSQSLKDKFLYENMFSDKRFYVSRKFITIALFSIIFLIGFASTVGAQNSLPGDPLYPVKIASEKIASTVNPSFKSEILIRRSEEIRELSNKNNPAGFHQTIEDYQNELKNNNINKENIEESRKNLEEAQNKSLEENKKDIETVIIQTQQRQQEIDEDKVRGESTKSSNSENSDKEQNLKEDSTPELLNR